MRKVKYKHVKKNFLSLRYVSTKNGYKAPANGIDGEETRPKRN